MLRVLNLLRPEHFPRAPPLLRRLYLTANPGSLLWKIPSTQMQREASRNREPGEEEEERLSVRETPCDT